MAEKRRKKTTQTEDESQGSEFVEVPDAAQSEKGAGPIEDEAPPAPEREPGPGSG